MSAEMSISSEMDDIRVIRGGESITNVCDAFRFQHNYDQFDKLDKVCTLVCSCVYVCVCKGVCVCVCVYVCVCVVCK